MVDGGDFFNHIVALDEIDISNPTDRDLFWIIENNGFYFEVDLIALPGIVVKETYTPEQVITKIWRFYENPSNNWTNY